MEASDDLAGRAYLIYVGDVKVIGGPWRSWS